MIHRLRFLVIMVLLLVSVGSYGQDPQFSQFYAAPLYLNPAFTGSTQLSRIGLNYRNQWPSINASYVTYTAYADHFFVDVNSGVGLLIQSDRESLAGLRNQGISAFYAYQLPLTQTWTFRAGFQGGYFVRDLDFTKLTFGDQFDESGQISPVTAESFNTDFKVGYLDLSFGGLFYNRNFWIGFSAHHLNTPNLSYFKADDVNDRLPRKYSVHAGYKVRLRQQSNRQFYGGKSPRPIDFYPALNYRVQGEFMQFDVGGYFDFNPIIMGLWYRGIPVRTLNNINANEALVFSVGFSANGLNIGYSFDYTLSALGIESGGAHEVSISYQFFAGDPRKPPRSIREIPCPKL